MSNDKIEFDEDRLFEKRLVNNVSVDLSSDLEVAFSFNAGRTELGLTINYNDPIYLNCKELTLMIKYLEVIRDNMG